MDQKSKVEICPYGHEPPNLFLKQFFISNSRLFGDIESILNIESQ
jgi:hypothetical protein